MISKLKIRTKMMLWYTLLTTILLGIFLPVLYSTISDSLYESARDGIKADMAQVILAIGTGEVDYRSTFSREKSADSILTVVNEDGNLRYDSSDESWLNKISFSAGTIRTVKLEADDWFIYDKTINVNRSQIKLRVGRSLEDVEKTLRDVSLLVMAVVPAYFLITIVGGLFIARRSLRPINEIVQLTKQTGSKNLSGRIAGINSKDEVGDLATNFNRMLDTLEESFEKEKRFVSDASHELRTPVSVIMANAESMAMETEDPEILKSIDTVLAESNRMNAIISQLLMLTRGLEGKYKLIREKTDIKMVTSAVIEQLNPQAQIRDIKLINKIEEPVVINADQSLVTQLFLNIIGNAIKYGRDNGSVIVDACIEGDYAKIIVNDDGIGISNEDLPHIFERFYRSDKARDRSGSGLGLSIVKWIIDEHRGSMKVTSTLGKGTKFEIAVPIDL